MIPPLPTPNNPTQLLRGWSLWVPLPHSLGKPKWINLNERAHWGSRSGKTAIWRGAARLVAEQAEIPTLGQAWVQAVFRFGDGRRRDVHNYLPTVKACIDGFTDANLWEDDRDGILVGPDLRRARNDCVESLVGKGIAFSIWEVADVD